MNWSAIVITFTILVIVWVGTMAFLSYYELKDIKAENQELRIDQIRQHWMNSKVDCDQEKRISLLESGNETKINERFSLCNDIADAWVVLGYRGYGVTIDEDIIKNWTDKQLSGTSSQEDKN